MKRLVAVAFLTALLATGSARAQPQATAQVDPVKLELAQQLVAASGGAAQAQATLKQMYVGIGAIMAKAMPPQQAERATAFQNDVVDEVSKLVPSLVDMTATAYAQTLTEKQLRDALAWQTSESGQAIIKKMPQIMSSVMTAEAPYLAAAMPRIMQRVIDRVCEETKCSPADREMMTAIMAKAVSPRSS